MKDHAGKSRNKKPKDYPKKPLTAYNIFFKETREKILVEHGRTNFQEMGRNIAALWKEISYAEKVRFDSLASKDSIRYREELKVYEKKKIEEDESKKEEKTEIPVESVGTHRKYHTDVVAHANNARMVNISEIANASNNLFPNQTTLDIRRRVLAASHLGIGARGRCNPPLTSMTSVANLHRSELANAADLHLRHNVLGRGILGKCTVYDLQRQLGGDPSINGHALEMKNRLPGSSFQGFVTPSTSSDSTRRIGVDGGGLSTSNLIDGERCPQLSCVGGHNAIPRSRIQATEKSCFGAELIAATNTRKRKRSGSAFDQEKVEKLVDEAMMRFSTDGFDAHGTTDSKAAVHQVPRLGGGCANDQNELWKHLSIRNRTLGSFGTQMKNDSISCDLKGYGKWSSDDTILGRSRLAEQSPVTNGNNVRQRMSMDGGPSLHNSHNASQHQMHLVSMMMRDKASSGGYHDYYSKLIHSTLEETLLREIRARDRERMIIQYSGQLSESINTSAPKAPLLSAEQLSTLVKQDRLR